MTLYTTEETGLLLCQDSNIRYSRSPPKNLNDLKRSEKYYADLTNVTFNSDNNANFNENLNVSSVSHLPSSIIETFDDSDADPEYIPISNGFSESDNDPLSAKKAKIQNTEVTADSVEENKEIQNNVKDSKFKETMKIKRPGRKPNKGGTR
ncbi:hypothetical protein ILUMI_12522 [Ignelater luminosus]|uniref:Uncharacterized protein n=1 Tax=Ignelater luminosus TaxID=2038154 RepID=A0A8K0CU44_IGNLU|nr:hypothetical protein ILUMI_12522 [Ignelater luminosus]